MAGTYSQQFVSSQTSGQQDPVLANGQTPGSSLYRVPTGGVGASGEQVYDVFSGGKHIADPNDPLLKGVNINNLPLGTAPKGFQSKFPAVQGSKFEQGFNKAKSSGADVPKTPSGEKSLIDANVPPEDTSGNLGFLQENDYLKGLISSYQAYIDPKNQQTSLVDTYNKLIKDSGIQSIDSELVNMQNVMNGTEDDIRMEVTKSGGFATDSQVLALTSARNKQLIKNYNNLVALRDSKSQYLQTEIGLAQSDKQSADQRFNTAFNMEGQIAQMGIQMQSNAVNRLTNLVQSIGYDGIYKATGGDSNQISLIEKALGLPAGGLAQQSILASQERSISVRQAQATIAKTEAEAAKARTTATTGVDPDVLNGMLSIYSATGVVPPMGLGNAAIRSAFYAAIGSGGTGIVNDAQANKAMLAGANTALKTQMNQYNASLTSIGTLEKQLSLAQKFSDKVSRADSPFINKYLLYSKGQIAGDADTAAFQNIVKTASYEFAKILSGAAASIAGVTVTSAADAENLLNSSLSKGQFNAVMDLMKQEAQYRLTSQKDTINQLQSDISSGFSGGVAATGGTNQTQDSMKNDIQQAIKDPRNFPNREALIDALSREYGITKDQAAQEVYTTWTDNTPRPKASGAPTSLRGGTQQFATTGKIVAGYDIGSYATDPNHEKRIASIYSGLAGINDLASLDNYIRKVAPGSPITSAQVMSSARQFNVDPKMIVAIMQQDSSFGTVGKGARSKNPGNVGNDDTGRTVHFRSWQEGVDAVAKNLAKRKVNDVQRSNIKDIA